MKNLRLTALAAIAATIFIFPVLSCNKAETAKNSDAPIETSAPNNSLQTARSNEPQTENQTNQTKDLLFLRDWIGKYPINKNEPKFDNLFNVPQIRNLLVAIVGRNNFQNLLKHFAAPVLIEEKNGFVVIFGTTGRNVAGKIGYGLIAVQPETGETHVFLVDDGKLTDFSSAKGGGTLPIEIKQSILTYTGQSPIIGKIKRKPDAGYICYAVLLKDWDAPQATRPYIFYITDDGGRMNVEAADIDLKLKSENEKKGENGKTYVEWIYENKTARARFDMFVSEVPDSSAVVYDGTVTVTTFRKTQTAQIKAFCGG